MTEQVFKGDMKGTYTIKMIKYYKNYTITFKFMLKLKKNHSNWHSSEIKLMVRTNLVNVTQEIRIKQIQFFETIF